MTVGAQEAYLRWFRMTSLKTREPDAVGNLTSQGDHTRRRTLSPVVPVAFGIYAVLLMVLTLLKNRLSFGGLWDTTAHDQRSLDLVLFNGFQDAPIWWGPWVNTFGNIALFLPLGFFLYAVLRARRSRFPWVEVVVFSALTSLAIECLQWVFAVGYSDVDDLLFNTIGGAIGATIAAVTPRRAVPWLSLALTAGFLVVLGVMVATNP